MNTSMLKRKVRRLRAMSLPEIAYRTGQNLRIRSEKRKAEKRESIDEFLARQKIFPELDHDRDISNLFENFRHRDVFVWQLVDDKILRDLFNSLFADNKSTTYEKAEQFIDHEFDLFDQHISFNSSIEWNFDILQKKKIPMTFWAELDYHSPGVVREVKYVWELNRHQHFITLAKAYLLTGQERFARELFDQWHHWIDHNPYLFGINWKSSLEIALRLVAWVWALQMAKESQSLTPELFLKILQSVEQHAEYISRHLSRYSSANNHLLGEALGLVYAGAYFPELIRSEHWLHKGADIISRELVAQVYPDGVIKEQSTFYVRYLFDYGVLAQIALNHCHIQIPEPVLDILEKMAEWVAACMDGSGHVPLIGDDDGGQAVRLAEADDNPYQSLLVTASVLFDRGDFKEQSHSEYDEKSFWLLGLEGLDRYNRLENEMGRSGVIGFSEGGYTVIRRSQPFPQVFIFDHGPLGLGSLAAHGHADALSFTLYVNDKPVLIDSGTYLYLGAGEAWRTYFRGTAGHNTIMIDDLDQSEPIGTFQWGRKARARLVHLSEDEEGTTVVAEHNGYHKLGAIHRRHVRFVKPDTWIISDNIQGKGLHKIRAFFHLSPCYYSVVNGDSVVCDFGDFQMKLMVKSPSRFVLSVKEGTTVPIMGWYSEHFGTKKANPTVVISLNDLLPIEMKTILEITPGRV